jgi:ligand-binding sensor domain-containing protein
MGKCQCAWRGLVPFFLCVSIPCQARAIDALNPDTRLDQYSIRRWGPENGAPGGMLRAVLQASDGYIWLGSLEGLARFDGVRFDHFDLKKLVGAQTNGVYSLAESSDGALWIGTYSSGLVRYQNNRFHAFKQIDGLSSNTVSCLARRAGLPIIPFDSEDEAVRIANDTPYGLSAGIQTGNMSRAIRCQRARKNVEI